MNTKLMMVLIVLIFIVLAVTYSWNADVSQPKLGTVVSLEVSQGGMLGMQSVGFDAKGKITATQTNYTGTSTTQTKTGVLNDTMRTTIILATLQKHDATRITNDPTPPPDTNTSRIQFEVDGQKYDLRCTEIGSACSKLADELFANFASILTHQKGED